MTVSYSAGQSYNLMNAWQPFARFASFVPLISMVAHQCTWSCRRFVTVFLLSILAAWQWQSVAMAAPAPADQRIENQAELLFFNPNTNSEERVLSPIVVLRVRAVPAFELADAPDAIAAANDTVVFNHTLTNTGNVDDNYILDVANLNSDDFNPDALTLYIDSNNNGVIDSSDPIITSSERVPVTAGESVAVLLEVVIPSDVNAEETAEFSLVATSELLSDDNNGGGSGGEPTQSQTDRVVIQAGDGLTLVKDASPASVQPGESITFTINVAEGSDANSDNEYLPITINLDGNTADYVVLRDVIPANTTFSEVISFNFVAGSGNSAEAIVAYHRRGDPLHTYQSNQPSNQNDIDAVALLMPEFSSQNANTSNSRTRVSLSFAVTANQPTSSTIRNIAELYSEDEQGNAQIANSNETSTVVNNQNAATIDFYNRTFDEIVAAVGLGDPLFIEASAAACNTDAQRQEQYSLELESELTGDIETVTVTETSANSGVFRISNVTTAEAQNSVTANNGVLEVQANDQVNATLVCANITVDTQLLIDPFGVVFDSRTNQPVAGASVTLIDVTGANNGGNLGGPATVFARDGSTPAPSTVITGADGRFEFPLVASGTYQLVVVPPTGYEFASEVSADQLPADRVILTPGSYGGTFEVVDQVVQLDVPVDSPAGILLTNVTASPNEVLFGETSQVCAEVINFTGETLSDVRLNLALPPGFIPLDDGFTAEVNLGDMGDGERIETCVTVLAGPNVLAGGVELVFASATGINPTGGTVASNISNTQLRLKPEQLFGTIVGRVFVDCDNNRLQGVEEPGIPAVRVVLNNGQWAISDSEGMYHFAGLSPQTYVLRIDETTLPSNAELAVLDTRNGGDARSRWVDLRQHDLHKANFAEGSCTERLLEQVAERRRQIVVTGPRNTGQLWQSLNKSLDKSLNKPLNLQPVQRDLKSLSANGSDAQRPAELPSATQGSKQSITATTMSGSSPAVASPVATNELIKTLVDTKLRFIDWQDGSIATNKQPTVRLAGRLGGSIQLSVNGKPVSQASIGQTAENKDKQTVIWTFVGVQLQAGTNTLTAQLLDPFGNVREQVTIDITAPGEVARLAFITPPSVVADGDTAVKVTLELQDIDGYRVARTTPVTVGVQSQQPGFSGSGVQWQQADIDPAQAGVQVLVTNGQAQLTLAPPVEPVSIDLVANLGVLETKHTLNFKPYLRPLMIVGSLETGGFAQLSDAAADYDFAQQPMRWSDRSDDGKTLLAGRASVYAKGDVGHDVLLTARYESEEQEDELFRDIDPDQFYTVHGDASITGFDARSTQHAYLRLDRGQSSLLYGDFNTESSQFGQAATTVNSASGRLNALSNQTLVFDLGRFSRVLTGVKSQFNLYESAPVATSNLTDDQPSSGPLVSTKFVSTRLDTFVAKTSNRQMVDELPALGTSGPYQTSQPLLRNSEQIAVLVRDRTQPALILSERPLQRFTDYRIEPDTGDIILRAPLASISGETFNPVSLRVRYATDSSTDKAYVAGAKLLQQIGPVQFGLSSVLDQTDVDDYRLHSLAARWQVNANIQASAEWARSSGQEIDTGDALRAEVLSQYEGWRTRLAYYRAEQGFDNLAASARRGRTEWRLDSQLRLDKQLNTQLQVLHSEDSFTGETLRGAQANLTWSITDQLQLETGLRYSDDSRARSNSDGDRDPQNITAKLRLKGQTEILSRNASLGVGIELDPDNTERRVIDLQADYAVSPQTKLYARHELASTLNNRYSLDENFARDTTTIGIESRVSGLGATNSKVYSEYRARNAFEGRDAEAVMGLRNRWQLADAWRLDLSLEQIEALDSSDNRRENDSFAATTAVIYRPTERLQSNLRLEYRETETKAGQAERDTQRWLGSIGLAWKLNRSWSLLGRGLWLRNENEIKLQDKATVEDDQRLQLGLAWRNPDQDQWQALIKHEYRRAKQSGGQSDSESGDRSLASQTSDRVDTSHALRFNVHWQPSANLNFSHFGSGRWFRNKNQSSNFNNAIYQAGIRARYQFAEHWDVAALTNVRWDDDSRYRASQGIELGWLMVANLWLNVGYNFTGFDDRTDQDHSGLGLAEDADEARTASGAYFRLRFKFDEQTFGL